MSLMFPLIVCLWALAAMLMFYAVWQQRRGQAQILHGLWMRQRALERAQRRMRAANVTLHDPSTSKSAKTARGEALTQRRHDGE